MDTLSTAASAMRWPFRASSDARCITIRRRMPPRASRRSRFTYVRRRGASAPPAGAEMVVSASPSSTCRSRRCSLVWHGPKGLQQIALGMSIDSGGKCLWTSIHTVARVYGHPVDYVIALGMSIDSGKNVYGHSETLIDLQMSIDSGERCP